MKKKLLTALVGASIIAPAMASSDIGVNHINSVYDLLKAQERYSNKSGLAVDEITQSARLKAMYDYARQTAMRQGIKSQIRQIKQVLLDSERELDAIYDFNALMIKNRVVPPVITEARDLYNQDGNFKITLADAIYSIKKQARFSSTAPNWREYLDFPTDISDSYSDIAYMAGSLKPETRQEIEIWQKATVEGWDIGVKQANALFTKSMEQLTNDYVGMVRFHEFVMQDRITMPIINYYNLYDKQNGEMMVLNESMLKIDVLPTFKKQSPVTADTSYFVSKTDTAPDVDDLVDYDTPVALERLSDLSISTIAIEDNTPATPLPDYSINDLHVDYSVNLDNGDIDHLPKDTNKPLVQVGAVIENSIEPIIADGMPAMARPQPIRLTNIPNNGQKVVCKKDDKDLDNPNISYKCVADE